VFLLLKLGKACAGLCGAAAGAGKGQAMDVMHVYEAFVERGGIPYDFEQVGGRYKSVDDTRRCFDAGTAWVTIDDR
jgi:hypothetical protein